MFAAWVLFPLLMLAVCTGCGLLLEAVAGWRLPGTIVPLAGLAVAIVAMSFTTNWTGTAEASTPLLAALGLAGLVVGRRRIGELRPEPWALLLGIVTLALFAAPVVLSGNATFLGYYILNDSSFHLGLASLYVGHGPRTTDLYQDGYTAVVGSYITTDYPVGADVTLGALSKLMGQNVAWNLQPFLALSLTFGALGLYELLGRAVSSRPLRAACALVAGANGLLYSLYTVASIKELVTTTLLTLLAWTVVESFQRLRPRSLVPLLIAAAAALDVIGVTAVPWIGVPLVAFVLGAAWYAKTRVVRGVRAGRLALSKWDRLTWLRLGPLITVFVLGLIAVIYPILAKAPTAFTAANVVLGASPNNVGPGTLGYLVAPLKTWQIFGIWPDYDFRFPLYAHVDITFVLIGVEIASGLLGSLWLIRKRGWGPLILLVGGGVATVYLLNRATPYAASKVLLIVSVAIVLACTTGAAALYDTGRRIEAWLLLAALAVGVFWTDTLAYRYSSIAPSGKLHELAAINQRYNGQGPTLYPYGQDSLTNTMLASLDPSTADTPGVVPKPGLQVSGFQMYQLRWDTDNLDPKYLRQFNLLVMDGSPAFSRPPADFKLINQGRYYNVWRRTSTPHVIKHIGFGTFPSASAIPSCRVVLATARLARRDNARLDYVLGAPTSTFVPAHLKHLPFGWVQITGDPEELIPREGPGTLHGTIDTGHSGSYQVWMDGSYSQKFTVSVDGHQVGSIADQLGPLQQATKIATVHLSAGRHAITLERPPANELLPGADDPNPNNRAVGPVMFVENHPNYTVSSIAPSRARTLCGKSLDWLEIVR